MNMPEPGMKITVGQLRPLQRRLQQWKDDHGTTYTAMARQCDLGKGTIASVVSTPILPSHADHMILERAPTWRLVARIATGLQQELGTLIPESLWSAPPPLPQHDQHDAESSPKKGFPYSLVELGIIGTEKCQQSALYNLPVGWEEKIEFHMLLIHGAVGDAINAFRQRGRKAPAHDLAKIIIMTASLAYQFDLDLEAEVSTLAKYYREKTATPSAS